MPFSLASYKTADQARKAIEAEIPKGSPRNHVEEFITRAKLQCFDPEADTLACRYLEPSLSLVHVSWSLAFYFNEKRELDHVVVNRGLTGP
jgi:hypothetical protein